MNIYHDTTIINPLLVTLSKFRWVLYIISAFILFAADKAPYGRFVVVLLMLVMILLGLIYKNLIVLLMQSGLVTLARYLLAPDSIPYIDSYFLVWVYYFIVGAAISVLVSNYIRQQQINVELAASFSRLLDSRDPYTAMHSENVANYAKIIAEELGLTIQIVKSVYLGGLLHDIGKISIPEAILNKKEKLSDDEFTAIKAHPNVGYNTLKNLSNYKNTGILDIILHHHERYDGKGYPNGLKGDEIPYLARIAAVADAFDAMTTSRVYRGKKNIEAALAEIQKSKGTQFDPAIADAFIKVVEKNKHSLIKKKH